MYFRWVINNKWGALVANDMLFYLQAKIERMNILNIILRTERLDVSVLNMTSKWWLQQK